MVEKFKNLKLTRIEILKMFKALDLVYLTSTQRGDVIIRYLSINDKPIVPITDYIGYLSRTQGASSA
jgi:hypothetical protein